MWQLYQFPLCPFSRKVRLVLGEKSIGFELVRCSPWQQKDDFVILNPAAETPVLVDAVNQIVLIDSSAICEYLEETVPHNPLINGDSIQKAEIRRLIAWFDLHFFQSVVGPLLEERMRKRIIHLAPPESNALREAMRQADEHLDYIDYLLDHRRWLAGAALSLADLAAAAHISVADYLGGINWKNHEQAKQWYSAIKSRPSFQPLLSERMEIVAPLSPDYDKVDF